MKEKNNNETFIDFVEIESTYNSCNLIFTSKILMHANIREVNCLKLSTQINQTISHQFIKIVNFIASTKNQDFDLQFKS